jgi:hypothetical protein
MRGSRALLREILDVRQVPGDAHRRVFFSDDLDLTVWLDNRDGIVGFELCYDKETNERAVRWSRQEGFQHQKVDDGENRPGRYKATPILVPDGEFPVQKISRLFQENSRDIDQHIAKFIYNKLLEYPA